MEFHNATLLPKGLPEIMAAVVPYDIQPLTRVLVYPRSNCEPYRMRKSPTRKCLGRAGYDGLLKSFYIAFFPSLITFHKGRIGTYSFSCWFDFLRVGLHEIGHLATMDLISGFESSGAYDHNYEVRRYVEKIANSWAYQAMSRILRVDSRLGQPPGALTGYPGIMAYKFRATGDFATEINHHRINEWRALKTDAQFPLSAVITKAFVAFFEHKEWKEWGEQRRIWRGAIRRAIYRAREALHIERCFTNRNGRRYPMFNAGEAERVYEWLVEYKHQWMPRLERQNFYSWQYIEGNWELIELESEPPKPIGQFVLPSFSKFKRAYGVPTR